MSLITWIITRNWRIAVLVGYYFFILSITVLIRVPRKKPRYRLELFWSWRAWKRQHDQIIANVLMFVPIGALIGRWWGVLVGFGWSAVIEVTQLLTHRGLFEFDDMVHNTVGAAIGCALYILFRAIYLRAIHLRAVANSRAEKQE